MLTAPVETVPEASAGTGPPGSPRHGRSPEPPWRWGVWEMATVVAITLAVALLVVLLAQVPWSSAPGPSLGGTGTTPQATMAAGAPADAAAIAARTDPGLVDIEVTDTYQGVGAAGTGMVLRRSGLVVTNNHVVEGATVVKVTDVGNHTTYGATVLGYDRSLDVAVLQLRGASGLRTVRLGNSSLVAAGDGVVAVGNAGGTRGTPSYAGGSVTAVDRTITAQDEVTGSAERLSGLIATNADVVPGDSGGALVDAAGAVVGMTTAGSAGFDLRSGSTGGYAVPVDVVRRVVGEVLSGATSASLHVGPTAFLGVLAHSAVLSMPGAGDVAGAQIVTVVAGGPAAAAGLLAGDLITAVDGHAVASAASLTDELLSVAPTAAVSVTYVDSSGLRQSVRVQLREGPAQ